MTSTMIPLIWAAFMTTGAPEPDGDYGYLCQPACSLDRCLRLPMVPYRPEPGDVLILSNPNLIWGTLYAIALTSAPGHTALVVRMPDGELGVLEAGYNDKPSIAVVPLKSRLPEYKGRIWVRKRKTPISDEQSKILCDFACVIAKHRYGVFRLLLQMTPFRNRGPLRTFIFGKPHGVRKTYVCSESVLEGLVLAGLVDAETTRPSATYPRDLFFEHSCNLYINRHPPLACDWEIPALWRRCLVPRE